MKHSTIPRILALLLVLALIVICILLAMPVHAAECRIASAAPGEVLPPDPERVEMLACVIYQEAGGDACSDLCRMRVGDVALTRELDPRFPSTLEEVLLQPGQYGTFSRTGIVWPARASKPEEAAAVQRAYETAEQLLAGEHSDLWGRGYVWQSENIQGKEGFWCDGIYFGR